MKYLAIIAILLFEFHSMLNHLEQGTRCLFGKSKPNR